MSSKRMKQGVLAALVGASLWGLSGACAQFLLEGYEISPSFITAFRMLGAGVLFLIVLMLRQPEQLRRMFAEKETVRQLCIFGMGGLFLCQFTYVTSVGFTNAGTATVLQSTGIVFTMLATCLFGRTLPQMREILGLFAAMVSVWFIATQGDVGTLNMSFEGLVWGIINGMTVALYIMYPKRLFERWGSLSVTGIGMFLGGLVAVVVCIAEGAFGMSTLPAELDWQAFVVLGIIVLFGTFAAFALYLHGVSIVGSVKGSLLGAVEPLAATVLSALWLGTAFSGWDWLGFVLMIAMIFLVTVEKPLRNEEVSR